MRLSHSRTEAIPSPTLEELPARLDPPVLADPYGRDSNSPGPVKTMDVVTRGVDARAMERTNRAPRLESLRVGSWLGLLPTLGPVCRDGKLSARSGAQSGARS